MVEECPAWPYHFSCMMQMANEWFRSRLKHHFLSSHEWISSFKACSFPSGRCATWARTASTRVGPTHLPGWRGTLPATMVDALYVEPAMGCEELDSRMQWISNATNYPSHWLQKRQHLGSYRCFECFKSKTYLTIKSQNLQKFAHKTNPQRAQ